MEMFKGCDLCTKCFIASCHNHVCSLRWQNASSVMLTCSLMYLCCKGIYVLLSLTFQRYYLLENNCHNPLHSLVTFLSYVTPNAPSSYHTFYSFSPSTRPITHQFIHSLLTLNLSIFIPLLPFHKTHSILSFLKPHST